MKSVLLGIVILTASVISHGQKVDSIFFHLYTDSLKKGTHNYINVDGKLDNGRWLPLTSKEITFSSSAGSFEGNSLFIERDFAGEKVSVKAVLKENPALVKETIIFIKKKDDNEKLKTIEEVLQKPNTNGKNRKRNS